MCGSVVGGSLYCKRVASSVVIGNTSLLASQVLQCVCVCANMHVYVRACVRVCVFDYTRFM